MYAVIEAGGKQYRVEVGTELDIDLVDAAPGASLAIERVLLVADGNVAAIGRPTVANASVAAEVVNRLRGEKLISFKYRPKARRRVKKGHRQELTRIRISDIVLDGKSAAGERAKVEEARLTERHRLEEAARKQAEQDAALAAKLAKATPAATADTKPEAKAKAEAKPGAKAATKPASKASKAGSTGEKATGVAKPKPASATKATTTKATTTKAAKASTTTTKAARAAKADTSEGGTAAKKSAAKPRRSPKAGADEPTE
jgi:large subunit ribosomal protein L21